MPPFLSTFSSVKTTEIANVTPQMAKISSTTVHIMALDGVINVNSLFTLGIFLGLTLSPGPTSTLVSGSCSAGTAVTENLVSFHVYSFSSFLFSSLIASALKEAIKVANGNAENEARGLSVTIVRVNLIVLRVGILFSGVGSVFGCGFLMMALVNLIQIKLGVLSCKSFHTLAAVSPLVTLVPLALVIYVGLVLYAFSR